MVKELSFSSFGPKEVLIWDENHSNEKENVHKFPIDYKSFRCDGDGNQSKATKKLCR